MASVSAETDAPWYAALPEHDERPAQRLVTVEFTRTASGHGRNLSVAIPSLFVDIGRRLA